MKKTRFPAILALIILSVGNYANAAFDTLCGYLTVDGIGPTMVNYIDWSYLDAVIYSHGATTTSVVPPLGVTVSNNPQFFGYLITTADLDFMHYLGPYPLPSGVWSISGSTVVTIVNFFPPSIVAHPDSPFTCISTDLIP
jgi:hypothetical protein